MVRSRSNRRHVRFLIDRWAKRSRMTYGVWTYEDQSQIFRPSVRLPSWEFPPGLLLAPFFAWGGLNVPPCAVARAIALALSHVRTARLTLRHARAIDQAHTPPVFGGSSELVRRVARAFAVSLHFGKAQLPNSLKRRATHALRNAPRPGIGAAREAEPSAFVSV